MKIGKKIAEARKKKNLTQEQLAELMAVTRQTVSRWELNLAYPEMEKVVKLASLLKVSCDYLLNDDYESPTDGAESAGGPRNPVTRLLLAARDDWSECSLPTKLIMICIINCARL